VLVDFLEQRTLHVELLDDRFHDPVGVLDLREIAVEAAGGNQLPRIGGEERIRLQLARAIESLLGGVGGDVEEQRRDSCVCEMSGDLRAHGAGAEDGHGSDHVVS